jgi:hypothetical protein
MTGASECRSLKKYGLPEQGMRETALLASLAFWQRHGLRLAFVVAAVVTGAVASTGEVLVLALVVGGMLSLFLLTHIEIAIWLLLVGALWVNGWVTLLLPKMNKIAWALSMLGFFLLCGAAVIFLLERDRRSLRLPAFVLLLLILVGVSCALSFVSGRGSAMEILAGIKRAYQLVGLVVALALLPVNEHSRRCFDAWIAFFSLLALLQLPMALFQRIVLVPMRVGMGGGVVPLDIVSGTFESYLRGGGSSSVMVMFLTICVAYGFAAWQQGLWPTAKLVRVTVWLAAPLFLGETKIALVLLPMMFLLVLAPQARIRPILTLFVLFLGGVLVVILGWLYFASMAKQGSSAAEEIQRTIEYNFGSAGYYEGRASLNRASVLTFWGHEHGLHNPLETVFGHGLGSSYSSRAPEGTGALVAGHLSRRYRAMAINLTTASTLLWETGLLGTGLLGAVFVSAWRMSGRLFEASKDPILRARLTALRVSLAVHAVAVLYSNALVNSLSQETLFAFSLGYLAWLARAVAWEEENPGAGRNG